MKIYIAGPIKGNSTYKEDFAAAEEFLRNRGYDPVNPARYGDSGFTYGEYIDIGLALLRRCDAICMLPGWEKSAGATLERQYAKAQGIAIFKMNMWEMQK